VVLCKNYVIGRLEALGVICGLSTGTLVPLWSY